MKFESEKALSCYFYKTKLNALETLDKGKWLKKIAVNQGVFETIFIL